MLTAPLLALPLLPLAAAGYTYYSLGNLPHKSESGQTGYNDCGTTDSQSSMCQTAFVNSVTDFCLWAPPAPGGTIGDTEEIEVAWCTASGHGARLMPQGTVHSAHMLVTPHYTQITGTGDFTKINVQPGDEGGELDPHGATGNGNPVGSLVFSGGQQIHEWTSFISDKEFCFRICHDSSDAWLWCQHIYDLQGCAWNEPGNYGAGFDTCQGDGTDLPPGVYSAEGGGLSTYQQSQGPAPTPHAAGKSSNCQAVPTVGGQAVAAPPAATTASSPSAATNAVASSASQTGLPSSASSSWTTSLVSSPSISSSSLNSTSTLPLSSSTTISSAPVSTITSTLPPPTTPITTSTTQQALAAATGSKAKSGAGQVAVSVAAGLGAMMAACAVLA
ncbi:macrofage activating glycoprotein [Rhodotorula toruloides]|uniref:Macrofage activating glycoprotein n=1 Tax=Rhodotorula toruloides TaxID=5286 RepID=A0A511KFV7_RHOTO|nr:macrofage activating glycoprotein [Rhodotorula toruloides]